MFEALILEGGGIPRMLIQAHLECGVMGNVVGGMPPKSTIAGFVETATSNSYLPYPEFIPKAKGCGKWQGKAPAWGGCPPAWGGCAPWVAPPAWGGGCGLDWAGGVGAWGGGMMPPQGDGGFGAWGGGMMPPQGDAAWGDGGLNWGGGDGAWDGGMMPPQGCGMMPPQNGGMMPPQGSGMMPPHGGVVPPMMKGGGMKGGGWAPY